MEPVSLPAFWRGRRGSVAVETAIAVALLVIAFAGVMQIVHSVWVSDRMDRAARSAARAIAFTPGAEAASLPGLACAAIRKELDLGEAFDCGTTLSVTIENGLAPGSLAGEAGSDPGGTAGELVRVRIAWSGGPWNPGMLVSGDDADSRPVATAIARREPIEGR
ncbi:MAG: pilus assembly protein [Defluviicoccus sp.]|nr:pilus assembly protein [Defluviicoccus sp.]